MRSIALALMWSYFVVCATIGCDSKKKEPGPAAAEDAQTVATLPTDAAASAEVVALPADAAAPATIDAGKATNNVKESRAPSEAAIEEAIANTAFLKVITGGESEGIFSESTEDQQFMLEAIAEALEAGKAGSVDAAKGQLAVPDTVKSRVQISVKVVGAPSLDKARLVRRIRSKYLAGIRRCHERRLKKFPHLKGSVTVEIMIGSTGRVAEAGATGFDASIDTCIESLTRKWRFGAPKDSTGKPTTAQFELSIILTFSR